MQGFNTGSMCDIIDVTLYKFNHYDNLIWTKCLNQLDYTQYSQDSILVTPYQLKTLLHLNFKRELLKIRAISFDLIHKDANSLYFLDQILKDFDKLKWIKITLSKTRNFSRAVNIGDSANKQIKYSFKIVKATLRLNNILSQEDIESINPVLLKTNLISKQRPYNQLPATSILTALDIALNTYDISDEQADALARILDTLSFKMESDNPDVLLVTDW